MAKNKSRTERRAARVIENVRDDTPAPVYANNVTLYVSRWDLKFSFGEIKDVTDEKLRVNERVVVVMSPQHALAFAETLNKNLKTYEDHFGPIPRRQKSGANGASPSANEP